MKKTNKIVVVIVLALVLIFGIGQFFTSSISSIGSSSSNASSSSVADQTVPQTPPTQIIHYIPPQPTSSTLVESGSCWTNSIAAPFRADAWRCAVGNGINDPCFQIPNSHNLLCGINPSVANSTSTFVLKLTKPLPTPEIPPAGTAPADWAWLVQLDNGTLCSPFTGTLPAIADNESANYDCAPGPLGDDLLIFNNFNTSSSQWTAEVGTLSQSTSGLQTIATSSTVPIQTIWQ